MRIVLSGQPSRQQSQVEMRIATLTTDNEHLIKESDNKQEFTIQENKKQNEFKNKLIIHYTHENRFNTCKRDMHRIFQDTIANNPIIETKLIVGNRNQRSTMRELIRKRPRHTILKNKAKQSMINKKEKTNSSKHQIIYIDLLLLDVNHGTDRQHQLRPQNQTTNNQI
jgi:hypothetical protein